SVARCRTVSNGSVEPGRLSAASVSASSRTRAVTLEWRLPLDNFLLLYNTVSRRRRQEGYDMSNDEPGFIRATIQQTGNKGDLTRCSNSSLNDYTLTESVFSHFCRAGW